MSCMVTLNLAGYQCEVCNQCSLYGALFSVGCKEELKTPIFTHQKQYLAFEISSSSENSSRWKKMSFFHIEIVAPLKRPEFFRWQFTVIAVKMWFQSEARIAKSLQPCSKMSKSIVTLPWQNGHLYPNNAESQQSMSLQFCGHYHPFLPLEKQA